MRYKLPIFLFVALFCLTGTAMAHFGMVIPQQSQVERPGNLGVSFMFWHPFENQGMDLVKPAQAGVFMQGQKSDLLPSLAASKLDGKEIWLGRHQIKKPGDYYYYMVPKPYWEPVEDSFIIHYTKVCVSAMGAETGWDQAIGLRMEIMPLTRPYGLYAGNSFSGQVLFEGQPLPDCEVEVEYYNPDGAKKAPTQSHITQLVKCGPDGTFSFGLPWKGWWGFAALYTDPKNKIKKNGQPKDVELGGVIWVYVD